MATRYFFSQFWCEFTAEVLNEFYQEDIIYREQEAAKKQMENMSELEKKREELKGLENNKSSVF